MAKKIKMPGPELIKTLRAIATEYERIAKEAREMADYAEVWTNTDGQKIGIDSHMNKKYDDVHRKLLHWKRALTVAEEDSK